MQQKHWRKSDSILKDLNSSLTIFSSSVTFISSLHRLHLFFFLSNFLFSLSHFLHCHQIFSFSVSFKPSLNCQVASYLATLTNIFDKIWQCLGWCQLKNSLVLLHSNTALISIAAIFLKLIFFFFLGPLNFKVTRIATFNYQCFSGLLWFCSVHIFYQ